MRRFKLPSELSPHTIARINPTRGIVNSNKYPTNAEVLSGSEDLSTGGTTELLELSNVSSVSQVGGVKGLESAFCDLEDDAKFDFGKGLSLSAATCETNGDWKKGK